MQWKNNILEFICLMESITLSTTLVNQILGYLATKPFQEVAPLIDAIQKEGQKIAPDQHVVIPA